MTDGRQCIIVHVYSEHIGGHGLQYGVMGVLYCVVYSWSSYPAGNAGVLWIVFDRDSQCVFSNSLSVQRPVHLNHS